MFQLFCKIFYKYIYMYFGSCILGGEEENVLRVCISGSVGSSVPAEMKRSDALPRHNSRAVFIPAELYWSCVQGENIIS